MGGDGWTRARGGGGVNKSENAPGFNLICDLTGRAVSVCARVSFVLLFWWVRVETGGNGSFLWGAIVFPSVINLGRKNSSC